MKAEKKIKELRQRMKEKKITAYLVSSSDFHNSEYVGDYFKCREYISGFTGSAGNVVIGQEEAGLWTDGRYFLQAEKELEGSGIALYRMGEENVPELEEYLLENLPEHANIGVDGRTVTVSAYRKLQKTLNKKNIEILTEYDLIGEMWKDRPEMSCQPVWELDARFAGKTRAEKLSEARKELEQTGADYTVISSLADIAWILNVRGNDVSCTPVVLSYLVIGRTDAFWFVQQKAVSGSLSEKLQADGITLRDYQEIYEFTADKLNAETLYLDPRNTNMLLYQKACEMVKKNNGKIVEGNNITMLPKAIKNSVEIENMRKAHIKDAVACIKFIYWLKKQMEQEIEENHIKKESGNTAAEGSVPEHACDTVTEITAAKKLEEFRMEQEHYLGASFHTIAGYAQHGAIIHYRASSDTDIPLRPEGLVLIDSGGHYLEGTTDITRTVALGKLTQKQKHHYTLVLKGCIHLAAAKFKYGCSGIGLDFSAREILWKEGLDYNHGTGHGVGYLLSVHEPPNSFRNIVSENMYECMKIEPGMITSDEPGIYIKGEYGIRLENMLVCKEIEKNQYGRFLGFETLTLVPFDRDAVLTGELDEWEREYLNRYHARVFDTVGCYLAKDEQEWLKAVTAPL